MTKVLIFVAAAALFIILISFTNLGGGGGGVSPAFNYGEKWEDLRFPIENLVKIGSKAPDEDPFRDDGAGSSGTYLYWFDKSKEEELFFVGQMPHSWLEGSSIKPHIHWTTDLNLVGNVVWGLECTKADVNSFFPLTTILTVVAGADGNSFKHFVHELPEIDMTGFGISSVLVCRVFRDGTDGADTYNNDAGLIEVDLHYLVDSIGSDEQFVK